MTIANNFRVSILSICVFIFPGTILSGCQRQVDEISPDNRIASLLLSRGGITDVQLYKDETAIHGPTYFYFRASRKSEERLINWLELRKHQAIPDIFSNTIKTAIVKTKWKFNLNASQVYLTYYCHPFDGVNWSLDLLLIDDQNVMFVTEGYVPQNPAKYDDPSKCNSQ